MSTRAPVMFIGHGSPMFAVEPGKPGELMREFSAHFVDVEAVLIISPHWMTRGLEITAADSLEIIHDFGGFPRELYQLQYDAPGSGSVAETVQSVLVECGFDASLNHSRGRDHGAWVPMIHLLPDEKLPVLQLSLDANMDPDELVRLGETLKGLREQGIAVIASGSLTHNLYEIQHLEAKPADYVGRFTRWVREQVEAREVQALSAPHLLSDDFARAHPSAEHYLPLLIAMGATDESDRLSVLDGGVQHGVISMESYGWV
ncbi:dioxygenase [Pontibacterium sp.]|uniref:dioxygenase family protein n=1 Tax=Pontibacterium sp. TaxID=2036026 RepID=UPI0035145E19